MKFKFAYSLIIASVLITTSISAQFRFGSFVGSSVSQVDGDGLKGFNYLGFSSGLLGGYKLDNESSIIVDLGFNTFGSVRKSENPSTSTNSALVENKFQSINILIGYQIPFGNNWDGIKKNEFRIAINFHRLIKKSANILNNHLPMESFISNNLKSQFIALNGSFGRMITSKMIVRVGMEYGLGNLVKMPDYEVSKLSPYWLYLILGFYVF